jgi:hypothetical protein
VLCLIYLSVSLFNGLIMVYKIRCWKQVGWVYVPTKKEELAN